MLLSKLSRRVFRRRIIVSNRVGLKNRCVRGLASKIRISVALSRSSVNLLFSRNVNVRFRMGRKLSLNRLLLNRFRMLFVNRLTVSVRFVVKALRNRVCSRRMTSCVWPAVVLSTSTTSLKCRRKVLVGTMKASRLMCSKWLTRRRKNLLSRVLKLVARLFSRKSRRNSRNSLLVSNRVRC